MSDDAANKGLEHRVIANGHFSSITHYADGKPVLGWHDEAFLILGCDNPATPPLGRVTWDPRPNLYRPDGSPDYPWGLLVFDHRRDKPLDVIDADREALRFAVALANDRAPTYSPERSTGQKSYAAWASFLREHSRRTQVRHHNNMFLHLRVNRSAAAAFLEEIAGRSEAEPADHLRAAADLYRQLVDTIAQAHTNGVDTSAAARDELADVVTRLAELDGMAAAEIEQALRSSAK